jgi:hypothetical protein
MEPQDKQNKYRGDTPQIECFTRRSKDGKYVIHKTVITHLQRTEQVEAILRGEVGEEVVV